LQGYDRYYNLKGTDRLKTGTVKTPAIRYVCQLRISSDVCIPVNEIQHVQKVGHILTEREPTPLKRFRLWIQRSERISRPPIVRIISRSLGVTNDATAENLWLLTFK